MPIYEYRCSSCGHQQEFLQKVSDPQLSDCTACGKATFTKMLTAAGFQLKGSGWYATDFKSKPAATSSTTPVAAKTGGDKAGDSGGKSEGAAAGKSEGTSGGKSEGGTGGTGGVQASGSGGCAACS